MLFESEVVKATLLRRYKRFLSDVRLPDGSEVVAHCGNPGSMLGLSDVGMEVWLLRQLNPKAKLSWRWEVSVVGGVAVGINTMRANALASEAIRGGVIPELSGYSDIRREVRFGEGSRLDFLLSGGLGSDSRKECFVEVKSVTLKRDGGAEFPDARTERGLKHLRVLSDVLVRGYRSVLLFIVQRSDCVSMGLASDIDPAYAEALVEVMSAGVEVYVYACDIDESGIRVVRSLPFIV